MPTNIRCVSCGTTILGLALDRPTPINREACPNCKGTEFELLEE